MFNKLDLVDTDMFTAAIKDLLENETSIFHSNCLVALFEFETRQY